MPVCFVLLTAISGADDSLRKAATVSPISNTDEQRFITNQSISKCPHIVWGENKLVTLIKCSLKLTDGWMDGWNLQIHQSNSRTTAALMCQLKPTPRYHATLTSFSIGKRWVCVNWVEKCNQLKKDCLWWQLNSSAQKMYEQAIKELFRCITNFRKRLKLTSWWLPLRTQSLGNISDLEMKLTSIATRKIIETYWIQCWMLKSINIFQELKNQKSDFPVVLILDCIYVPCSKHEQLSDHRRPPRLHKSFAIASIKIRWEIFTFPNSIAKSYRPGLWQ